MAAHPGNRYDADGLLPRPSSLIAMTAFSSSFSPEPIRRPSRLRSRPLRLTSASASSRAAVALVGALAMSLFAPRASAQIIDTATPWLADGAAGWSSPFGEPGWRAWGQTFVTPAGFPKLDSFSVWVQSTDQYAGYVDTVDFDGRVYEWNTSTQTLVGSALYISSARHIPHEDHGAAQEVSFAVGGLVLDPTKTYMFFLSAYDFLDGQPGVLTMGASAEDYPGGGNFIADPSNYAGLFSEPWEANGDMVFRARFSAVTPVPEPASYGVIAAGLLVGLALRVQRRTVYGASAASR